MRTSRRAGRARRNGDCPSEEAIDRYVVSISSCAELAQIEAHILFCQECQLRVEDSIDFVQALHLGLMTLPAESGYIEQRREARTFVQQVVEFATDEGRRTVGAAVDRSPHGLGIVSPEKLEVGAQIKILLEGVQLVASVRHCMPGLGAEAYRVGIQFQ